MSLFNGVQSVDARSAMKEWCIITVDDIVKTTTPTGLLLVSVLSVTGLPHGMGTDDDDLPRE